MHSFEARQTAFRATVCRAVIRQASSTPLPFKCVRSVRIWLCGNTRLHGDAPVFGLALFVAVAVALVTDTDLVTLMPAFFNFGLATFFAVAGLSDEAAAVSVDTADAVLALVALVALAFAFVLVPSAAFFLGFSPAASSAVAPGSLPLNPPARLTLMMTCFLDSARATHGRPQQD